VNGHQKKKSFCAHMVNHNIARSLGPGRTEKGGSGFVNRGQILHPTYPEFAVVYCLIGAAQKFLNRWWVKKRGVGEDS